MWAKARAALEPADRDHLGRDRRGARHRRRARWLKTMPVLPVRATGTYIGHGFEPQFAMNIALAALVLGHDKLFPPLRFSGVEQAYERPARPDRRHRGRPLARRRHGVGRGGRVKEERHGIAHGKTGRPIVVVTGMGVVTSLGAGKADNGQSSSPANPASTRSLASPPRGSRPRSPVRSISCRSSRSARPNSASAWRHWPLKKRLPKPGLARKGDFPVRFFLRSRRSRSSGRIGEASPPPPAPTTRSATRICCARAPRGAFTPSRALHVGLGRRQLADRFGTKGSPISVSTACASGASAIQLGVEAIRRGETDAALCIGTDGSVNPEA